MALLGSKYKRPSGEENKNPNKLKVTVLKQVSKNLLPGKFSENRFFLSCIGIGDRYSKSLLTLESCNTVVTIPENLPLSNSEKSVLSKGLNFVPIPKKLGEFSVKQDVEKFLRHIQLKALFHHKEDDSNTLDKDTFEMLQVRKSKWTSPEGQFASLNYFINKCRHDINKLNFNRNTKFSNLSSEERAALQNLSERKDIIVKASDKGGT